MALPLALAMPMAAASAQRVGPAGGQAARANRVELVSQLGMYFPLATLVREGAQSDGAHLKKKQVGAGLIGFRVTVPGGGRVSYEGSLAYTPSLVAVTTTTSTTDVSAGVLLGSVRARFRLGGPPTRRDHWRFHVAGGVGVVSRHGTAWNGVRGTTDATLTVGTGAQLRLGSASTFRIELENHISRAKFAEGALSETGARMQHDLVWSLGVALPIGRAGRQGMD